MSRGGNLTYRQILKSSALIGGFSMLHSAPGCEFASAGLRRSLMCVAHIDLRPKISGTHWVFRTKSMFRVGLVLCFPSTALNFGKSCPNYWGPLWLGTLML